jgi:hypothetical protein
MLPRRPSPTVHRPLAAPMHDNPTLLPDRHGGRDRRGLSVVEAARVLGVTPDSVRSRLRRGTLEGYRDNLGRWRVVSPDATVDVADRPATGEGTGPEAVATVTTVDDGRAELVAELTDELAEWRSRALVAEALRDEFRARVAELRADLERERQRAGATEARQLDCDRLIAQTLREIGELRNERHRRRWPGFRGWWRRVWDGEG